MANLVMQEFAESMARAYGRVSIGNAPDFDEDLLESINDALSDINQRANLASPYTLITDFTSDCDMDLKYRGVLRHGVRLHMAGIGHQIRGAAGLQEAPTLRELGARFDRAIGQLYMDLKNATSPDDEDEENDIALLGYPPN